MNDRPREDGYYWVMEPEDHCWIIGIYKHYYSGWFTTGDAKIYNDNYFIEIDEEKLKRLK